MKFRLRLFLLQLLALFAGLFVRASSLRSTRILYIKPDHLGDLLLATPVLAALRAQHPTAQITALVGPWSRSVLARNPDVDVVLTCPFPGFTREKAKDQRQKAKKTVADFLPFALYFLPYITLAKYALLLRAGRYDVAIIGRDDHWWGAALALLAGVPRRIGYAVPECRPFLTDALAWDARAHVTQQGLDVVAVLDARPLTTDHRLPAERWDARFDPDPADLVWADEWLHANGITPADQLVIIHPGTAGPTKLWLVERWAEVAATLHAPHIQLVLTGGPDEVALVAQLAALITPRPLTLAGQTTLGQLAALLRRATLVLGVDSGPLHLAAAQGVPTVHLYGPSDAERFGSWGSAAQHRVVNAGLWCSPCGVFAACPRGLAQPECMVRIEKTHVVALAREQLDHAMHNV